MPDGSCVKCPDYEVATFENERVCAPPLFPKARTNAIMLESGKIVDCPVYFRPDADKKDCIQDKCDS
jgi:hypothetical protein